MTVNKKAIHLVPMFPSEVQHVVDLQQFVSRATFPLSSSDFLLQDNMQLNPQVIWLSLINITWLSITRWIVHTMTH